jgi:hypothetical protein
MQFKRLFALLGALAVVSTSSTVRAAESGPGNPIVIEEEILDEGGESTPDGGSAWQTTDDLLFNCFQLRLFATNKVSALDKAIASLRTATATNYWIDESHLRYPSGAKAFTSASKALTGLKNVVKKRSDLLNNAQLNEWSADLAEQYRRLAYNRIVEAARAGVSVQKLYGAWKQYLRGEADLSAGKYSTAINRYGTSWKQAGKLHAKLLQSSRR